MNTRIVKKQQFVLSLGNEQVTVTMQVSRRKSMKLQLNAQGEVEVKIPIGMAKSQVLAFLTQHHLWLLAQRERFQEQQQQRTEYLYWLGQRVSLQPSDCDKLIPQENIWYYPVAWQAEQLLAEVDKYQRAQAYQEYAHIIQRWWPHFVSFGSLPTLRVKKMRTRWGSLSKRGYINLNLALMHLPYELRELVIVHELCHLKYFDHGAGFKALMRQCLADVAQREAELAMWERKVLGY